MPNIVHSSSNMSIEVAGDLGIWLGMATVVVEGIIAILLYRTVKDYSEVGKVSRIEAKQRLRPWIGPTGGIDFLKVANGKHQYSVTIKNYGEIPATCVIGMSFSGNEPLKKEDVNITNTQLEKFNLGPLLPNMEKRYWIFVGSEKVEYAIKESRYLYTAIYFFYEFAGERKSGYGMISQLDPKSNTFIHKEMWIDQEESKL